MIDFESDKYKTARQIIKNHRDHEKSWNYIFNMDFIEAKSTEAKIKGLSSILGCDISIEEWHEILEHEKSAEEDKIEAKITINPYIIIPSNSKDFNYTIDNSKGSVWSSYRKKLYKKGFDDDTVNTIEYTSLKILNRLSLNTRSSNPLKGLVIGNVQSGKTANMAGLMAMAADQGWNMFIILSGTIENLRIQTQERIIEDLNSASNVVWFPIANAPKSPNDPCSLRNLVLTTGAKQRYLAICLKYSSRLKDLLHWLSSDVKQREKLKILFIDDEADQAGVNSARKKRDQNSQDRTKINQLIVNLLTNKNERGEIVQSKFQALNYVAYTATPYANILNEEPGPESIYPSNFVCALPVSRSYIGPQAIFGLEGTDYDGMNIVNTVDDDITGIERIKTKRVLPKGLKEALLWFYCCLAIERVRKVNKPFSMLIHTSQRHENHERIAAAIKEWISGVELLDFLKECKNVYLKETKMFSKNDFINHLPDYPNKNIADYPDFKTISDEIAVLFKSGLVSIKINEEGDFKYKDVHLCIDNCSHNGIENEEHIRLLYPKEKLDKATGFIVIGGATLSRGLTIEGLVSSYFLRTVHQADTLMQMGRWFGYKIGYELLPRLWLTTTAKNHFNFLSTLDYELRAEMKNMEEMGVSPELVGIKVRYYPKRSVLDITAKNKQKAATTISMDYSGFATQTTIFYSDQKRLEENYQRAIDFISSLGNPIDMSNHPKAINYLEWDGISNEKALAFITSLQYPNNDTSFLNLKAFKKWYEQQAENGVLKDWHIVVAGLDNPTNTFKISNQTVCKINRSKKNNIDDDGLIRIGALRAPKDIYVDLDLSKANLSADERLRIDKSTTDGYREIRRKAGISSTSLLVIYFIDKNSKPRAKESNRIPLNAPVDLVGLSLIIPDSKLKPGLYRAIDLTKNDMDNCFKEVDVNDED